MRSSFRTIVSMHQSHESGRGFELKKRTKDILESSLSSEDHQMAFSAFSESITAYLKEHIRQTCDKLKTTTLKRTKLWELFHRIRCDKRGVLNSKWNQ